MKWGLIARSEDRGLGNLTWEVARNLHPDRTLEVVLGELARGFAPHHDRYPTAVRIPWSGHPLDTDAERVIRSWLDGLDVVYSAETFYDWRIVDWARDAGCATVLHVMPEFWPAQLDGRPMPDAVWAPTTWRLDALPAHTRLVPVPVALDRFAGDDPRPEGPLRVLHVAGHKAAADRNGTQAVTRTLASIRAKTTVTITGQDGRLPTIPGRARGRVELDTRARNIANYWDLYAGHDVLLQPRRYGGLCLPVQEGLAAGLVPILPDVEPNQDWPAILVPAVARGTIATAAGVLPLATVNPRDLAATIDSLADDPELLADRRRWALDWAEDHSWDTLAALWLTELDRAR